MNSTFEGHRSRNSADRQSKSRTCVRHYRGQGRLRFDITNVTITFSILQCAIAGLSPLPFVKWAMETPYRALRVPKEADDCHENGSNEVNLEPMRPVGGDFVYTAGEQLACRLSCQAEEFGLADAFAPWWDHRLPYEAANDFCSQSSSTFFLVKIVSGRVFYRPCADGGSEPSSTELGLEGEKVQDQDMLLTLILEVVGAASLPDMAFIYHVGDQPLLEKVTWSPFPIFHSVRSIGHWDIPMPNPFHVANHFRNRLGDSESHKEGQVPWSKKINKVFWRGALSAPDNIFEQTVETLPRIRLIRAAQKHPELFDVAIVDVDEEIHNVLTKAQMKKLMRSLKNYIKEPSETYARDQTKYKYLINVCAVLSSWRLSEMLSSGSLLLLQYDSTNELIYDWLTPWENFVPISSNLSDLIVKLAWLAEHPSEAERIAEAGYQLFQRRVRRQDTYCYILQALTALSRASKWQAPPKGPEDLNESWVEVSAALVGRAAPYHTPLRKLLAVMKENRAEL